MIKTPKARILNAVRVLALSFLGLICLAPFYVAVCYAFKSKVDLAQTKLAFPTHLYLGNFIDALNVRNFFDSVKNSAIVAVCMVVIIILFCSSGAYIIARKNNKFYNTVYYIFQLVILIPFQTVMFPLYKELSAIGALNTLWGLCLAQAGVNVGYYVFLYTGFIKNVPISLEEAAAMVLRRREEGEKLKDAVKEVAQHTDLPRNELYAAALRLSEEG